MDFPLHLGVTEAGEGEDGRIKSAAGIGALLADGIGDTIRVSLSEPPEAEIPVAYKLAAHVVERAGHPIIPGRAFPGFDYVSPDRRPTIAVGNIGGTQPPVVISTRLDGDTHFGATLPDYVYVGRQLPAAEQRKAGVKYIIDADLWADEPDTYPVFTPETLPFVGMCRAKMKFLFLTFPAFGEEVKACLRLHPEMVIIAQSNHANRLGEQRALIHELWSENFSTPVVIFLQSTFGDDQREQQTIARIKAETGHLKGLKIGIMGCIVNGPGEMADADYGYVGAGPEKVSLYRGKVCVEKNIPQADAVRRLLELIEKDRERQKPASTD